MTGFLVDTNVVSEMIRPVPDATVVDWCRATKKEQLFLSVVSLGEIRKGLTIMPAGSRRDQIEKTINTLVPEWFSGRILPMSQAIAERWGVLEGQRQLLGRPLHVPDAQIAATALEYNVILVTRNVKDFQHLDLPIVNPWESA